MLEIKITLEEYNIRREIDFIDNQLRFISTRYVKGKFYTDREEYYLERKDWLKDKLPKKK